jgi:putative hemolysin
MNGGCLIVFPAGGVSTTPSVWHKRAVDAEWKNLTARLISQGKADVVPVFFAGQNSRLFQLASHLSLTLRLSLLFKEVRDSIGHEVVVRVGEVIPYERLSKIEDRQQMMNVLREATYALGQGLPHTRKRARHKK